MCLGKDRLNFGPLNYCQSGEYGGGVQREPSPLGLQSPYFPASVGPCLACEHQHDSLKRGTCIKQNRHIGFQDTDSIPLGNIAGFFFLLLLLFLAYRGNDFIKRRTNIAMEIK